MLYRILRSGENLSLPTTTIFSFWKMIVLFRKVGTDAGIGLPFALHVRGNNFRRIGDSFILAFPIVVNASMSIIRVVQSDGVSSSSRHLPPPDMDPQVQVFAPEYGYHTHAYMITKAAAQTLLENLPVSGPIDVWMADHEWFGVPTYSAVIANEGWKRDDGTYEGKTLVYQYRPKNFLSDVSPGK